MENERDWELKQYFDKLNAIEDWLDDHTEDYFYNPDVLSRQNYEDWVSDLDHDVYQWDADKVGYKEQIAERAIDWLDSEGLDFNDESMFKFCDSYFPKNNDGVVYEDEEEN